MLTPTLGLLVWTALLLLLMRHDGTRGPAASPALWLPVIWMFIIGSRLPAQWLGHTSMSKATAMEEGSPLDRTVLLLLIALAVGTLATRHLRWSKLFSENTALAAFLLYALA